MPLHHVWCGRQIWRCTLVRCPVRSCSTAFSPLWNVRFVQQLRVVWTIDHPLQLFAVEENARKEERVRVSEQNKNQFRFVCHLPCSHVAYQINRTTTMWTMTFAVPVNMPHMSQNRCYSSARNSVACRRESWHINNNYSQRGRAFTIYTSFIASALAL